MIVIHKRFRARLYAVAILCAASIMATGIAVAGSPALTSSASSLLPRDGLSTLHFIALSDATLARTTGSGLVPPAIAVRVPGRGRVTLWDEINVKPPDLGTRTGQISVTINSR